MTGYVDIYWRIFEANFIGGVNPFEKVPTFTSLFMYTRTKEAKVDKDVHLFFSFPTNLLLNKVKKVCYKIIFIHSQFIM